MCYLQYNTCTFAQNSHLDASKHARTLARIPHTHNLYAHTLSGMHITCMRPLDCRTNICTFAHFCAFGCDAKVWENVCVCVRHTCDRDKSKSHTDKTGAIPCVYIYECMQNTRLWHFNAAVTSAAIRAAVACISG